MYENERSACLDGLYGVVFDIKRFAVHDGPGIRTTVFLKGCPLDCPWCHNPESRASDPELSLRLSRCIGCGSCAAACQQEAIEMAPVDGRSGVGSEPPADRLGSEPTADRLGPITDLGRCELCGDCVDACPSGAREMVGRAMEVEEVVEVVLRDRVFYEESGGGVTFSGGEPLAQPAFLVEALRRCRSRGLHTAVDTTLHAPTEVVEAVAANTSVFLADIKHADPQVHEELTGVGNRLIFHNLRHLAAMGSPIIIRVPLVAGVNDDVENMEATGRLAASLGSVVRVDLLPYVEGGPAKSRRLMAGRAVDRFERPTDQRVAEAAAQLEGHGLVVTIGG